MAGACSVYVLTVEPVMSAMFPIPWRLERVHLGGTETVVEHSTFTVIFGAYLACASER